MFNIKRVRYLTPLVKPFPLRTLSIRINEKKLVILHELGLTGGKIVGTVGQSQLIKLNSDCEVGKSGEKLLLPRDKFIFQHVLVFGAWGGAEANFLSSQINNLLKSGVPPEHICFLDLGANVGLVTLQTLRKLTVRVNSIAVEPLPVLVDALGFNVNESGLNKYVKICPFALGSVSESALIYVDSRNFGSSSLFEPKVPKGVLSKIQIDVVSTREFASTELEACRYIVLKSDLEGYDCQVLSELPTTIWEKIWGGVIEVASDGKNGLQNLSVLMNRLRSFDHLSWSDNLEEHISPEEVFDFWQGNFGQIRNLHFTRKPMPDQSESDSIDNF